MKKRRIVLLSVLAMLVLFSGGGAGDLNAQVAPIQDDNDCRWQLVGLTIEYLPGGGYKLVETWYGVCGLVGGAHDILYKCTTIKRPDGTEELDCKVYENLV